jgi:hypothetical protein
MGENYDVKKKKGGPLCDANEAFIPVTELSTRIYFDRGEDEA